MINNDAFFKKLVALFQEAAKEKIIDEKTGAFLPSEEFLLAESFALENCSNQELYQLLLLDLPQLNIKKVLVKMAESEENSEYTNFARYYLYWLNPKNEEAEMVMLPSESMVTHERYNFPKMSANDIVIYAKSHPEVVGVCNLEKDLLSIGDIDAICEFALVIPDANIPKLSKYILATKNMNANMLFATLHGANKEEHLKVARITTDSLAGLKR